MKTPFIGFDNATLETLPRVTAGDKITCPRCGKQHVLKSVKNPEADEESGALLFYTCQDQPYLAGVAGRLILHQEPDVSGEIEDA